MDWIKLLKDLGIFGILVAGFTFIIRLYIKLTFSKELERYKGELQKEAISFKTTYENLHTQRAVVIRSVYKKLISAQWAFESLIKPLQLAGESPIDKKAEKAVKLFNDLLFYFHSNKIYFNKEIAGQLDNFLQKFKEIWRIFNKPKVLNGKVTRDIDAWDRAWQELTAKEIPPLLSKIEDEFRKIIGIE